MPEQEEGNKQMWQNVNNWGMWVKRMWKFFVLLLNYFRIGLYSGLSNAIFSKRPLSAPCPLLFPSLAFFFFIRQDRPQLTGVGAE